MFLFFQFELKVTAAAVCSFLIVTSLLHILRCGSLLHFRMPIPVHHILLFLSFHLKSYAHGILWCLFMISVFAANVK